MPKSYSDDLRKRVVSARLKGMSVSEASEVFGIHRNCVYRWTARHASTGSVSAYVRGGRRKGKIGDLEKFLKFAEAHAHSTLKQMVAAWEDEVSEMTMSRTLRKIGWSRKKRLIAISSGTKASVRHS